MTKAQTNAERLVQVESAVEVIRVYITQDQERRDLEHRETKEYREKQEKQFKELFDAMGKRGTFTFSNVAAIGAVVVPLITFAFFVVNQQIESTSKEQSAKIAHLESRASVSESERHKLSDQASANSSGVSSVNQKAMVMEATFTEKLTEVETQARSIAQTANLRAAHNQQLIGLLWQKTYNQPFPAVNYWPDISATRPHGN